MHNSRPRRKSRCRRWPERYASIATRSGTARSPSNRWDRAGTRRKSGIKAGGALTERPSARGVADPAFFREEEAQNDEQVCRNTMRTNIDIAQKVVDNHAAHHCMAAMHVQPVALQQRLVSRLWLDADNEGFEIEVGEFERTVSA